MKGDLEARQSDWTDAVKDYQQALMLFPDNTTALYGLGDESLQRGDIATAVPFYRRAVYAQPNASVLDPTVFQPLTIRESNAFRVMEYARLLSLTGQQEALTVYRHGAQMLNYMDGHPRTGVMLPDFGDGPGQIAFTPQRLQALAQVGWAKDHSDFDVAGAGARLQQAIALFPDSPAPYFYRGRYEARHRHDFKAVKADFDKAAQLGDAAAADAVQQERHFFRNFLPPATPARLSP
jgi:tetratricopeptide (TPR) repeat protein